MKKVVFKGSGVAIVTPFNDDGIDFDSFGKIIDFNIKNHTDAIVVCGTTGEGATMSDDEHKEALKFCVEYVNKRIPVIAGTGSNDTAYAVSLSQYAEKIGADALLQITPYYNKTTQRGLVKHFFTVADNVGLPIILYNVPSRTGMNILPSTFLELSQHKNIVAVKEASGNIAQVAKIRALCGDELNIYSGEDNMTVPMLSVGALGVISVIANVMPQETHDMCQLYFDGKVKESSELFIRLLDLMDSLFIETNPIPVKTALNLMGFNAGLLRLPLCEMSESNLETLRKSMQAAGIL